MKKAISLIVVIAFCLIGQPSAACSCSGIPTVQKAIGFTDAIFIGTILTKKILTHSDSVFLSKFPHDTADEHSRLYYRTFVSYEIAVEKMYKGKTTKDTVILYSGMGWGDCGIQFSLGEKYIIYADETAYFGGEGDNYKYPKIDNEFWTIPCSRTTLFNKSEIAAIEKNISPK